jgi:hypothetical protein
MLVEKVRLHAICPHENLHMYTPGCFWWTLMGTRELSSCYPVQADRPQIHFVDAQLVDL